MDEKQQKLRVSTRQDRRRARAIGISALLIMLMLTVAVTFTALTLATSNETGGGDDKDPPVTGGPTVFAFPLNSTNFTILKEYSGTQLQFNATMNRWQANRATAIGAERGTEVLATYAGVVRSVTRTIHGQTVTIDHSDGLSTVFQSLDNNVVVQPGDRVEKGQKIGTVGTTSTFEFTNTPHVRIEVLQDGQRVNPANFIDFEDK